MKMRLVGLCVIFAVMFASSCAWGSALFPDNPTSPVPADYTTEFDISDGQIHVSFKGAYRELDNGKPTDYVAFFFIVTSKQDMMLNLDAGKLFDNRGSMFDHSWGFRIGNERSSRREIIADVPTRVIFWGNIPPDVAGPLPVIARTTLSFNKDQIQFRKIPVQEWSVWEDVWKELKVELGL